MYGIIDFKALVSEVAYYKWLNGSDDTEKNWTDAVAEVLEILNGLKE